VLLLASLRGGVQSLWLHDVVAFSRDSYLTFVEATFKPSMPIRTREKITHDWVINPNAAAMISDPLKYTWFSFFLAPSFNAFARAEIQYPHSTAIPRGSAVSDRNRAFSKKVKSEGNPPSC
jgi:hypothetical protein